MAGKNENITNTFWGFHWTCAKHVGEQVWAHRRGELVSSLILFLASYVVAYIAGDAEASRTFKTSVIVVAVWLCLFGVYYILTAPWQVHRDPQRKSHVSNWHVLTCVVIVLLLALFIYETTATRLIGAIVRYVPIYNTISTYAIVPGGSVMVVANTSDIKTEAQRSRIVLVYRIIDNTIDFHNDTTIEKSAMFEITGGLVQIESKMSQAMLYRLGRSRGGTIEFFVVMLPNNINADQLVTLGKLDELHGQILGRAAIGAAADEYIPVDEPKQPERKGQ